MDNKNIFVSIVIPVYNGEKTIGRLVEALIGRLNGFCRAEIILVNDGSKDNSEKVCIELYRKYSGQVKFYSLAKNFSQDSATMAGLNEAKGDFAVVMDDDLQNPVSEVLKLIDFAAQNDFDAVYTYYKEKKHTWFQNFCSKFNDLVANVMLSKPKNLYLSTFKIINRLVIDQIIKYDGPYPYVEGLILRTTDRIGKMEALHEERTEGKSGYTIKKLFALWLNTFVNFSILPLRIFTISGFIIAIFGFLFGLWTLFERMLSPDWPAGYATVICLVALFSGIQLVGIGVAGEYLGRIFIFQNKKPQYVVRKRYE
ncbi:MAG TPA: glycosyltransferase family 2 protein [Candidatus Nanoarchaeia archaeon]|nr:glycosyltransferase family 2 protein [Candidatus Nanoarchaeia archaeon]